ncbi:MAG: phosphate regulon transcriptional regulator PhoB [Burkholderiales bacterium]
MAAMILIVEDEPPIQALLDVTLRHAGYRAECVDSAEAAKAKIQQALPDLILLDWMLPGQSGITLARQLRGDTRTRNVPIIMLTAKAQENDKIAGLETGIDDYMTKPFSPRELLARIKTVLRRSAPEATLDPKEFAGLRLEPQSVKVSANGEPISVGPTEFRLLHFFLSHTDRVYSRSQLLDMVWGDNVFLDERTVDVHIRRLRKALEPSQHDKYIRTVRGSGYSFSSSLVADH